MTTNNNYNETTEPDITMTTATYIDCRRRPSSALAVVLEIVSVLLLLLFIVLVDSGWFFISRASLRFARARIAYRRARIIWRINNETMTFNKKRS